MRDAQSPWWSEASGSSSMLRLGRSAASEASKRPKARAMVAEMRSDA